MSPHCHHCEYDLRGCTNGCCPECGTPIDYHKIDRKAVHRKQAIGARRFAAFGIFLVALGAILRLLEGGFSAYQLGLFFFGFVVVVITFIVWVAAGIETR